MKVLQITGMISLAVIAVLIVTIVLAKILFSRTIEETKTDFQADLTKAPEDVVTDEDIQPLPKPVRDWLTHVGVVGSTRKNVVTLSQHGKMKLTIDQNEWIDARASQIIRLDQPGYVWEADIQTPPVVGTRGLDVFDGREASMTIKVASLIPVANETTSKKLIQSSMHRFLMELPWYPSASVNNYISWQAIDENAAEATLSVNDEQVTAVFFFDQSVVTKVEALRFKETNLEAKPILCTGEFAEYKENESYLIPTKAKITWDLPEGQFTWYEFTNTDISYNSLNH